MRRTIIAMAVSCSLVAETAHAQRLAEHDPGCGPSLPGCTSGANGTWIDVDATYEARRGTQEPDHWQTSAEMLLFLAGGTVWYLIDDRNVADWDFDSLGDRFDERSFAFDNNSFDINFAWHPLSGAGFHAAARANGQSLALAALYGFVTSAAWEFVIEFKERTSVNDLVVTTGAGIPIGEFAYKLALDVQNEGAVARWTAGLPVALHDAIDGRETRDIDFWRRISLSYGMGPSRMLSTPGPTLHAFTLDGRIASIPGYLGPGRFARFFTDGDVVDLRAEFTTSSEGSGLDLLTDVLLLGHHRQSIALGPGGLHGEAVTLGTSLGFFYRNERHAEWRDRLSIAGLPGAALDTHVLAGPLELHVRGRFHVAFAGSHAPGFDAWQEANPDQRPKSILLKQGYYYGWGWWARLEAELGLGPLELVATVSYGALDSQEGLDRTQDVVTADVDLTGTVFSWSARLRYGPYRRGPFVELVAAGTRRSSVIEDTATDGGWYRYQIAGGFRL